jgi:hypothetical protein
MKRENKLEDTDERILRLAIIPVEKNISLHYSYTIAILFCWSKSFGFSKKLFFDLFSHVVFYRLYFLCLSFRDLLIVISFFIVVVGSKSFYIVKGSATSIPAYNFLQ